MGLPVHQAVWPTAGLRPTNKKIEAVIKPFKLEEAKNALAEFGIVGITNCWCLLRRNSIPGTRGEIQGLDVADHGEEGYHL